MSSVPHNPQSFAYSLGVKAASAGEPCVPEMVYVRRQDQVNFAAGYESITGPTFTTRQFTGSELPQPAPVAKAHGWSDYNADRHFARVEAHQRKVEKAIAMTAAFLGQDTGDIIFAA